MDSKGEKVGEDLSKAVPSRSEVVRAGFCCMEMGEGTDYVHFGGKSTGFADGLNVDCDSG